MEKENSNPLEIHRPLRSLVYFGLYIGKRMLQRTGILIDDHKHTEKLIEEERAQEEARERLAIEFFKKTPGGHQNEVIALILARSICRNLQQNPDAPIEESLLKLKKIKEEDLGGVSLYELGLSASHHNLLSKYLGD